MDKFVRNGHENVKFFVGPEIEQTPAYGKKTLFVVGLQDIDRIEKLAQEHKCPHIFLSANRSFDSVALVDGQYKVGETLAADWEVQIHKLLDKGYMVSLDYPAHKHVDVLKIIGPGIWQSRNFVPVLSVAIPCVNTSSVNLTVKIDDSNFKETNPGVWCMNHTEVTDSNRFTSWTEYGDDLIITDDVVSPEVKPVAVRAPMPVAPPLDKKTEEALQPSEEELLQDPEIKAGFDMNPQDLGLDLKSESKLKPESEEEKAEALAKVAPVVSSEVLADAYTDGTTEDKLAEEAPTKKKVVSKKVTT
jgi:hypothetical protein